MVKVSKKSKWIVQQKHISDSFSPNSLERCFDAIFYTSVGWLVITCFNAGLLMQNVFVVKPH